ncbi:hypothetical protein [Sphaerospermopsis aphanizomenoides]|nr:hypothetical protein [Sphaerospermopsis aphanizomenoides]
MSSENLETRFAQLNSINDVDAELAAMKTQILDKVNNPQLENKLLAQQIL